MRRDSQEKCKGGIKGKALFSSQRARALSCEAKLSVIPAMPSALAVELIIPGIPVHTRHSRNNFSVSFKNVCKDALQSHPSDILCFDPFLTRSWPWTAPCADRGQRPETSKLGKEKNYFLQQWKRSREKTPTHKPGKPPCWQQFDRAVK